MWALLTVLVLTLVSPTLTQSQGQLFDLGLLRTSLDANKDGFVTRTEFGTFFSTISGNVGTLTRCRLIASLDDQFLSSGLYASGLYDVIKNGATGALTRSELENVFFDGVTATNITVTRLLENIAKVEERVKALVAKPDDTTLGGSTFFPYTEFEVSRWAGLVDANSDNVITRQEISDAMWALDSSKDGIIDRCEYIEAMTSYKQHTVTSSKVYDVLFYQRDHTWADVDSDFLLSMIKQGGGSVTKQQFIDFFTKKNILAAGLTITVDGKIIEDEDNSAMTQFQFASLTSLVFVAFSTMLLF